MIGRTCPAVCDREGCQLPAAKMPELRYWATGHPRESHPPLRVPIGLAVCVDHAGDDEARRLTDHHHAMACSFALSQQAALPDKATATVKWWDVGDPRAPHATLWARPCLN